MAACFANQNPSEQCVCLLNGLSIFPIDFCMVLKSWILLEHCSVGLGFCCLQQVNYLSLVYWSCLN